MKNSKCIFCQIIAGELPGIEILRDDTCIVLMDIFPIRPGHLMIIPLEHAQFSYDLSPEVRSLIFEKASLMSSAVCKSKLNAKGANIVINEGKAANQHIPHLHIHVIPRYGNDMIFAILQFLTRFFNPFVRIGRRQRLQRQADEIRKVIF